VSGSVRHLRFLHELNLHSVDWMFRQICSNRVLQDQCLRRDVEEYLHLAMYWRSLGNHRACMSYLQELLRLQPRHALAIYLLAAQHGEIGSHERAIKGMRAALAINPRLYMARFQLGLLLLHVRRPVHAREALETLPNTPDPVLRTYAETLVALAHGNLALARSLPQRCPGKGWGRAYRSSARPCGGYSRDLRKCEVRAACRNFAVLRLAGEEIPRLRQNESNLLRHLSGLQGEWRLAGNNPTRWSHNDETIAGRVLGRREHVCGCGPGPG